MLKLLVASSVNVGSVLFPWAHHLHAALIVCLHCCSFNFSSVICRTFLFMFRAMLWIVWNSPSLWVFPCYRYSGIQYKLSQIYKGIKVSDDSHVYWLTDPHRHPSLWGIKEPVSAVFVLVFCRCCQTHTGDKQCKKNWFLLSLRGFISLFPGFMAMGFWWEKPIQGKEGLTV